MSKHRARIVIDEEFDDSLNGREDMAVSLEWIAERLRRGNAWDKGPVASWHIEIVTTED